MDFADWVRRTERLALAELAGRTIRVRAVYVRTGTRQSRGRPYPTVLVRDVREVSTGALLADHLWFHRGETWRKADLGRGDVIEFDARAIEYRTGYWGPNRVRRLEAPPRVDFRLTPPRNLECVGRREPWRAPPKAQTIYSVRGTLK